MQFDFDAAIKAGAQKQDINRFLAEKSGFDYDAAVKAGADDDMIFDHFAAREGYNSGAVDFDPSQPLSSLELPETKTQAVVRGAKESFQQIPELAWGLGAGAAAAGETMLGEGGVMTAAKEFAVKKYQEAGEEIAKKAQPEDSLTYSFEKAKAGDLDALLKWGAHGVGYAGGQAVQLLVGAGVGKSAAQVALKTAVPKILKGMVAKEAGNLAANALAKEGITASADLIAQRAASESIKKAATARVAGMIGEHAAAGAMGFGMEGGEIGGGLAEKSVAEGRALTGDEVFKGASGTILAGALEYVGNILGLAGMKGKLPSPGAAIPGVAGRAARGVSGGIVTGAGEGAQEFAQTGVEQVAQGQDPNVQEMIDAAGQGALFGGVGAVGGALSSPRAKVSIPPPPPIITVDEPAVANPDVGRIGMEAPQESVASISAGLEEMRAKGVTPAGDVTTAVHGKPLGAQPASGEITQQPAAKVNIPPPPPITVTPESTSKADKVAAAETEAIIREDPIHALVLAARKSPINLEEFKKDYGTDTVKELARKFPGIFSAKGKSHPDEFAESYGFESADQMVEALKTARSLKDKRGKLAGATPSETTEDISAGLEKINKEGIDIGPPKTVPVGDLNVGDKVSMDVGGVPDLFEHKGYDKDGNAVLEDGKTYHVDPFDSISVTGMKKSTELDDLEKEHKELTKKLGYAKTPQERTLILRKRSAVVSRMREIEEGKITPEPIIDLGRESKIEPPTTPETDRTMANAREMASPGTGPLIEEEKDGSNIEARPVVENVGPVERTGADVRVPQGSNQGRAATPQEQGIQGRNVSKKSEKLDTIAGRVEEPVKIKQETTNEERGQEGEGRRQGLLKQEAGTPLPAVVGAVKGPQSQPGETATSGQQPTPPTRPAPSVEDGRGDGVKYSRKQAQTPEEAIEEVNSKLGTMYRYDGPQRDKDGNVDFHLITDRAKDSATGNSTLAIEEVTVDAIIDAHEAKAAQYGKGKPKMSRAGKRSGLSVAEVTEELTSGEYGKQAGKLIEEGRLKVVPTQDELPGGSAKHMVAWHGSPHQFDKFSKNKIGTGEGAQAYGYGLYFAGSKDVAEWYRKNLSSGPRPDQDVPNIKNWEGARDIALDYADFGKLNMLDRIEQGKYDYAFSSPEEKVEAIGWVKNDRAGALYEVELAPQEDEYLLFDKPLSKQSEKVKAALAPIAAAEKFGYSAKEFSEFSPDRAEALVKKAGRVEVVGTGQGVYGRLSEDFGSDKAASEYLHSLGIRGIKYLDGTSRGKGEGNYNYVIFSDEDVSITAKYSRDQQQIGGAYLASTDRMYIVADAMRPGGATRTLFHESFHRSMARGEFTPILEELGRLDTLAEKVDKNGDLGKWFRVARSAAAADRGTEAYREEVGAYACQFYTESPNLIKKWVDRFIAKVKLALFETLGTKAGKLTPAMLREIAVQGLAARTVKENLTVGDMQPVYSRSEIIAHAKAFFSKLQQVAEEKFTGMKAQSVEPFLLKMGVKKAEIEATGVKEWLAAMKPTDKVGKEELADFVKANTVELEDVVLGPQDWAVYDGNRERYFGSRQEATQYASEIGIEVTGDSVYLMHDSQSSAQFSQYTEPGAVEGSYREMFVTAPQAVKNIPEPTTLGWTARKQGNGSEYWTVSDAGGEVVHVFAKGETEKEAIDYSFLSKEFNGVAIKDKNNWQDGHSQYSNVKNPVVRIRFNEVATEGRRILRIEEMQGPSADNQKKMPTYLRDNIYNLGVKRILAHAKANGFDGVALATKPGRSAGGTQADRYSLETQVEEIAYWKEEGEPVTWGVSVLGKDGSMVDGWNANTGLTEKDLADNLGKEIAKKIAGDEGSRTPKASDWDDAEGVKYLSGDNLAVGGSGLKQLYDVQLPALFKAYGKAEMTDVDGMPFIPVSQAQASYPLFSRKTAIEEADTISDTAPSFIDRALNVSPEFKDMWERFIYNIVDINDPRERIYKAAGKQKSAKTDILTVERLRGKKAAEEVARFMDEKVTPLLKELAVNKISVKDFEEYKHALHAPERNERMRRVNAKRHLDMLLRQMTDAEREPWDKKINDLRWKTWENDLPTDATHDGYLDLVDEIGGEIAAREKALADKQKAFDSREWTEEEEAKGTPERIAKQLENAKDRLERSTAILDKWKRESPRFSGITDEEAASIIEKLEKDPRIPAIKSASDKLDAINRGRIEILHNSGQLSEEEYNAIANGYKHYVPLMREGFEDKFPASGRITGPTGKPLKVAMGSMREVVNILANSVQNYQTAVARAHKAEAGRALYEFALANPDMGITVTEVAKNPTHDKEGNIILYPDPKEPDNGVFVRVDGERHLLEFDVDQRTEQGRTLGRFLDSIKGNDAHIGSAMNLLSKINRTLAMVNTSISPEFIFTNFTRDLQTALVHLEQDDIKRETLKRGVLRDMFPAIKGIWKAERGNDNTDMGKWYRDFAKHGGKIGWMQGYDGVSDLAKELENEMKLYGDGHITYKRAKAVGDFISSANTAIENGIRLSVYKNLVDDHKVDRSKAALIASGLTVDFTRHGKLGPQINALYMFANAGIQGNATMIKAMAKNKGVQKVVGGIAVAGFVLQMLALAGGDDETGEPYVLGVPEWTREKNMIFMIPGGKGKFVKIPMPYGYNGFYNLGAELANNVYMAAKGKEYKSGAGALRVATAFANSFNPLSSGTILQTLSPTVADPVVMTQENKSYTGAPLMPEQNPFGTPKPDSERYWKNVSATSRLVAQKVNELTGGDKYEPGAIDVSPETIDMMYDTVTGGLGRVTGNVVALPARVTSGSAEISDIPFVRSFGGAWTDKAITTRYYDAIEKVKVQRQRVLDADTPEEKAKAKNIAGVRAYILGLKAEKELKKIRKLSKLAEEAGKTSRAKELQQKAMEIQSEYLKKIGQ